MTMIHFDRDTPMTLTRIAIATLFVISLAGCASVKYGDKGAEARLRELQPVPDKVSLYVCREAAAFMGAGNRATAVVDNRAIGTLKPNNFAHAVVEPGAHDIYIKRNPGGDSGTLSIRAEAGAVVVVWVGMTGGGFGVLTVDNFASKSEGERCVKGAEYAVVAEP
jgi:hypothetical protein